jgi:DNA-binding transcriptional LysR family regulator
MWPEVSMNNLIFTFVAVVDAGSFSEAGRRLGLPKSAVSRRIEQLETRLGTRLLQRSTRAVRPTDVGSEYYRRCVHILAEIEDAEQLVRENQTAVSGKLRIQLPIELGMHIFGRVMVEFARENPDVSLQLELSSRHVDMIEERYDLAIRVGAMPDSSLVARKILSISRGLYASPEYLARKGEPRSLEDLREHSCLQFHTDYQSGDWVMKGPAGTVIFRPTGAVLANNLTVLREAAICGLGIAMLPRQLCRAAIETGLLRPVLRDWIPDDAEVFILYPSRQHLPMKIKSFLGFLDGRMDQLSAWMNAPFELVRPPQKTDGAVMQRAEGSEHPAHLRAKFATK